MTGLGLRFQESFEVFSHIDKLLRSDSCLALEQFRGSLARFNEHQTPENAEEAGFDVKVVIHAFLGQADGIGYALRQVVLRSMHEAGLNLPKRKVAEVMELKYDAERDLITEKEKYLSTEQGIKVALREFAKLCGSNFVFDTTGEGWRGFRRLVQARNAFTHPESIDDLYPREAIAAIRPTVIWFLGQLQEMFLDCSVGLGHLPHDKQEHLPDPSFNGADRPRSALFTEQNFSDIKDVLGRTAEYVKQLILTSSKDVSRSFALTRNHEFLSPSHQYAVRNAVRILFSDVEAKTSAAIFFIEAAEKRSAVKLAETDKASLLAGKIEDKLIAALTIFSREFGYDSVPEKRGHLWTQFQKARLFRDRLMHPKDISSLRVDPTTLITFLEASQYYNDTWAAALQVDPERCISKAKIT